MINTAASATGTRPAQQFSERDDRKRARREVRGGVAYEYRRMQTFVLVFGERAHRFAALFPLRQTFEAELIGRGKTPFPAAVKNPDRITSATIATNRGTVSINPPKRKSGAGFPRPRHSIILYPRKFVKKSIAACGVFPQNNAVFTFFAANRSSPGPPPMPQRYEKFYKF